MSQPKNQTIEFRKSPIDGLSPSVRGLIVDMDGVLWRDQAPIGDLPAVFAAISERGLLLTAATNNATKSADDYAQRLQNLGVIIKPSQIITSAEATTLTLARRLPNGGRVFVVGERGMVSCLKDAGFQPVTDPADEGEVVAVVAGMDRAFTYDKVRVASRHVRGGALFYGTNPDATFPTPGGLVPGSGAIIAAIAAAAEIQPTIIGKPSPLIFELAADRMGIDKAEVLVVGDRLETDIAGGQAWGSRTAIVLSGVSSAAQAAAWRPKPDIVAADLSQLVGI